MSCLAIFQIQVDENPLPPLLSTTVIVRVGSVQMGLQYCMEALWGKRLFSRSKYSGYHTLLVICPPYRVTDFPTRKSSMKLCCGYSHQWHYKLSVSHPWNCNILFSFFSFWQSRCFSFTCSRTRLISSFKEVQQAVKEKRRATWCCKHQ